MGSWKGRRRRRLVALGPKANTPLFFAPRGRHDLSDSSEDRIDLDVVRPQLAFKSFQFTGKFSAVRGKLRQRTVSLYRSMSYGLFCPGTI